MGSLSGRVTGPDGKPVASARVWTDTFDATTSKRTLLLEAFTDADGRFRLEPPEPWYRHRFDLVVQAEGLALLSVYRGTLTVFLRLDSDLGTLQLDRGRVFTGQVLDVDGEPCKDALVIPRIKRFVLGHTTVDIGPLPTLTTDGEGRIRTMPIPVGHLDLKVRYPGRQLTYVGRLVAPGGEEDLGTIRLENDVPVSGVVRDEEGNPIADASIGGTVGIDETTDFEGKFAIRGFGPNPNFQLNVSKKGYVTVIGRVTNTEAGIRYAISRGSERKDAEPAGELVVILTRAGVIEGKAIDAETGEPVHLDKVVVCNFERKPGGEVVLRGCRSGTEQTEPGRFRATFSVPEEYHLTFGAAGYHDAEAYTPKVTELMTIGGIVARMRRKTEGSSSEMACQAISGTVTRDSQPVKAGWVGLWAIPKLHDAVNAALMRGRTVVGDPLAYSSAPIRDGSYRLSVPFQDDNWYLVAEEPEHALTQVGPIGVALHEQKSLDIACVDGGTIRGAVKGVPAGWEGHVWVVAFSKTAVQAEARVSPDGSFCLPNLPAGDYGVKAGHEAYEDPETYPGLRYRDHPEAFEQKSDPWKQALVVEVKRGGEIDGIEVEFPQ